MAEIFGLDLGTTNTLAAARLPKQAQVHVFLDGDRPHPSVLRYHGGTVIAGRAARDQLDTPALGVVGDFVRSPKRSLGKGLPIFVGAMAFAVKAVIDKVARDAAAGRDHLQPGDTFLFNDTVANNIGYGLANATPAQIQEAARNALAEEFILAAVSEALEGDVDVEQQDQGA